VRDEEWPFAIRMSAYFFLVITSFWILKPIKKTLLLLEYETRTLRLGPFEWSAAQAELVAKVLNMIVAILAVAVFSRLSLRYRREQLSLIVTVFFMLGYGIFAVALASPSTISVWAFYLFGDLLTTLMVATFFAFLNDSLDADAAKRLLGLIGLGGVAGGFFGSTVLRAFIDRLDVTEWLAVTSLIGVAILFLACSAGRRVSPPLERDTPTATPPPPATPAVTFEGARLVLRSSYLTAILAMVCVYEISSTIVDFQFTSIVAQTLSGDEIARHIGTVYAITNGVSLLVQIFLTSLVMRRFGLGMALAILPMTLVFASGGFLLAPTLVLGSFLSVADNGLHYSLNQSSKETLYVPTRVEEKYRAKAFIDMFGQRFAKAVAVGVSLVVTTVFSGPGDVRWLSLALLPLLVVWLLAARHAGRGFRSRESSVDRRLVAIDELRNRHAVARI
jgi:AAA family ATP:ADP antiporter